MRWPWSSNADRDHPKKPVKWTDSLNATNWSHYTEPRNVIPTLLLTGTALFLVRIYKTYLRRIPSTEYIKPDSFRRRSLFGVVTSVGDADNFRLYHTPGGRLAGWGWFPGMKIPRKREGLASKTIHVRIAGVDAPELAHFGHPAQPHAEEALKWLTSFILHRRVRAYIYRRDQYGRVVATVFVRRWFIRRDVGLEMLKRGLATIYEAKHGSEFGQFEEIYRRAEQVAKENRRGLWAKPSLLDRIRGKAVEFESPRDYKTRMTVGENGHRVEKRVSKMKTGG